MTKIVDVDYDAGRLVLTYSARSEEAGVVPTAVVLNEWVPPTPKPKALSDLAAKVITPDPCDRPSRVAIAILRRDVPRFTAGNGPAAGHLTDDLGEMQHLVQSLDRSYLAIQGPPGTGKTYSGAHLVHALITGGHRRVGVTAMSHAAIGNLLDAIVGVFTDKGHLSQLRAIRRIKEGETWSSPHVTPASANRPCTNAELNLVAGTTWLFAGAEMQTEPLDVLIVDEAGQLSLADMIAACGAAHNVVLLGDPLQLANISKGTHPDGSGLSVLEHVLAGEATMPTDRGVFLSETRRMHPTICRFISEQIYEGRLTAHPDCGRQDTGAGTGLRWLQADHDGCSTKSEIEAAMVVDEICRLIGMDWTDAKGVTRPLAVGDFMVVAPYNDQVDLIRHRLDASPLTAGIQVGTVDKLQGQEAPVVFFTMTASTAADIPRGIEFLFSKNRLNVAISRARALAYVVCTEELLNSRARTVDEMELIGTLCAFVEHCAVPARRS